MPVPYLPIQFRGMSRIAIVKYGAFKTFVDRDVRPEA